MKNILILLALALLPSVFAVSVGDLTRDSEVYLESETDQLLADAGMDTNYIASITNSLEASWVASDLVVSNALRVDVNTNAADITTLEANAISSNLWETVRDAATNALPVINAMNYGAVGNGVANDTVALQAALDAAEAALAPLYIPTGTYLIYDSITNTPNFPGVIIYGDGEQRTQIQQMTTAKDGLVIDSSDAGNLYEGLHIRDIRFLGLDQTGIGLRIEGGSGTMARVRIEGCHFNEWGTGLLMNETDQSTVISSRFAQNGTGCKVDGNSNALNFIGCIVNDNSVVGFDIEDGVGINFIGCDLGNSFHAVPMMKLNNQSTSVIGCSFEAHKDSACIVSTNDTQILVDNCRFQNFNVAGQDPAWTSPAIELAPNPVTPTDYPTLSIRNTRIIDLSEVATSQAGIRKWGGAIRVSGLPYELDFTSTTPNGLTVEQVSGTYPTNTATVDTRAISPILSSVGAMNTDSNQVGQIYWRINEGSTSDDLLAVYAQTATTYQQSSLLNEKLLAGFNTWAQVQTMAGGTSYPSGDYITLASSGFGNRIGNSATCKIRFFDTGTPAVQPAAVADATDAASVITQLNDLLAKLRLIGLIDE